MKTILDVVGREHNLSDYNYFVTMTDSFCPDGARLKIRMQNV